MQSNELRIDNLVYKSLKSGFGRKLENRIGCQDIVRIKENIGSFNYEPIPITEEWLLKFGFEQYIDFGMKTGVFDLIPLQGFSYSILKKSCMIMHGDNPISHRLKKEYNYVHELQNLYFALTGTELTLKDK